MMASDYLKYTDEQLAFISAPAGMSIVLTAAAGSGKTATVAGRAEYLFKQLGGRKAATIAYTKAAAEELRMRGCPGYVGTIHSLAREILHEAGFGPDRRGIKAYTAWFKLRNPSRKLPPDEVILKEAAILVNSSGIGLHDIFIRRLGDAWRRNPGDKMPQLSLLEYTLLADDMLNNKYYLEHMELAVCLLTRQAGILKPSKYTAMLIDEAQDISPLVMAAALSMIDWSDPAATLSLIGDKRQAIFGFAGGAADLMEIWAKTPRVKSMELTKSFRVPQQVAKFIQRLGHDVQTELPGGNALYNDHAGFLLLWLDPFSGQPYCGG